MFLQPKRTKYKKTKKGKLKKLEFKANSVKFGELGLKTQTAGLISASQIEAVRRVLVRKTQRQAKIWIRIFPNLPITCKPAESRMGKGKGNLNYWAAKVKMGTILFEICGVPKHIAIEALKAGSKKLSVKTKIFD